tara:strand:- start:447 stop:743 length:297 start_codon:yes stop_codon:yes gene_type:complete
MLMSYLSFLSFFSGGFLNFCMESSSAKLFISEEISCINRRILRKKPPTDRKTAGKSFGLTISIARTNINRISDHPILNIPEPAKAVSYQFNYWGMTGF